MKKFKTIIIDDEIKSSENLNFLIQSYCQQLEVIAIYNHPLTALEGIKNKTFDLLFLDVEMPQLDGFQLLDLLKSTNGFKVIFTTAYKEYALEAIKKSASDYLLKPIDIQELIKSVNKIAVQLNTEKNIQIEKQQLIRIASVHGFDLLSVNDIYYLKSDNTNTEIFYTSDGVNKRIVATKSIKHFEHTLNGYTFLGFMTPTL